MVRGVHVRVEGQVDGVDGGGRGEGELYLRFLALKKELEERGWFDESHKRPIPFLPRRVGVVNSGTGAAVQDILNIIQRRFPRMPITISSVRVQVAGAAEENAKAIRGMNKKSAADVLIVGRGGGSMEDRQQRIETSLCIGT